MNGSARVQPKAADASPSRLAELTSASLDFPPRGVFPFRRGLHFHTTFAGIMLKGIGLASQAV
jgi:hypothetical protein